MKKDELRDWVAYWYGAYDGERLNKSLDNAKAAFLEILTLIEQGKPKVTREFVEKWTERIYCDKKSIRAIKENITDILKEAGVEIIEEDADVKKTY